MCIDIYPPMFLSIQSYIVEKSRCDLLSLLVISSNSGQRFQVIVSKALCE